MKNRKTIIIILCVVLSALLILAAALFSRKPAPVSVADTTPQAEPTSQPEPTPQAEATAHPEPTAAAEPSVLSVDYSAEENWAYYALGEDKAADLFLICPTVDIQDEFNMSMEDSKTKESFVGALNMERGIYEESTRMFAPY